MAASLRKVLIAGGGIGGVATALCLKRLGVPFLLLEQAAAFGEIGAGIQLSPNVTRLLARLGVGDELARIAVRPEGLEIQSWRSAERILWTPLGAAAEARFGAPYFHAHRADVLDLLVRALGRDQVVFGVRVESFAEDADGVTVTVEGGATHRGDVLIGADGVHSVVRHQLFGDGAARYAGNVAWRGTMPAEAVAHLGVARVSNNWWGPDRSVVRYFISAGRTLNWIGISRSATPTRESWSALGTVEDALAEYAGWNPAILAMIAATTRLYRMALYDRAPLERWTDGRVALTGDAAHAMLPYHAQGAAQSIEDAWVLAGCLADQPGRPAVALARYEAIRRPRANWLQAYSGEAEALFNMADPDAVARRDARLRENMRRYPDGFPEGQIRIYGYDAEDALRENPPRAG